MECSETFDVSIEEYVTAIRAVGADHAAAIDAGPLGGLDRSIDAVWRWALRAAAVGLPLLAAVPLVMRPGTRTIGLLLIVAAPVLLLVVIGLQRLSHRVDSAVDRRLDTVGDGMIDRTAARSLQKAVDRGELRVLLGAVTVVLRGGRLEARSADHAVTIDDVATAWRRRRADRLHIAPAAPSRREAVGTVIPLPAAGAIAAALEAGDPEVG